MSAVVEAPGAAAGGPDVAATLVLDASVRLLAGGSALLGGEPVRLLRLTPEGARRVAAWSAGAPVGSEPAARALAGRLIAGGLAHPRPAPGPWTVADVAVVVPARDRAELLAVCLARIGPARDIVVVDDGSRDPESIAAVAREGGARVVRHGRPCGPAAARNTGLAATRAPLVAFVDSDTRPVAGWLTALLAHLRDPTVGAVAPRIRVPAGRSRLAAYEAVRSPLDLGTAPGVVGPLRRIAFVPAATLLVRRAAAAGGFDESMRFGEDVDLVWRLQAAGWVVRYEPAAEVLHPHRSGARAWLAQRVAYGSSAGPLALRHRGRMRHVVVPVWALAPWALALAGRPAAAALTAAGATGVVAARLPAVPGLRRDLVRLAVRVHGQTARRTADACWRAYPPLLLAVAARSRRGRRLAAATLAVGVALEWHERRPALDPLRYGLLRAADDAAYAAGVWLGCLRARTAAPLLPTVIAAPALRRRRRRS